MKPAGGIYRRKLLQFVVVMVLAAGLSAWAQDEPESGGVKFSAEAAAIFNKRCTACHTYGKGIKVGPDLKGVNDRRKRDWLVKFVRGSSAVIKSGDPTATTLFSQFKQQRMPDWADLSEKQVNDIMDYIGVGGPDIKPADERNAELGTPAEIENGRRLFTGEARLQYGAQACAACHTVQGAGWGGTLGPELTGTYLQYQDRALTEFLRHPCFRWGSGSAQARYLTTKESFSIKAFLRHAALEQKAANPARSSSSAGGRKPLAVQASEKGKGQ
jgi:mono/diheme cytochrome c family protein